MDSSEDEDDLEPEEPLVDRRVRRKRGQEPQMLPIHGVEPPPPPPQEMDSYGRPSWPWVPSHYMPRQAPSAAPWSTSQPSRLEVPWPGRTSTTLEEFNPPLSQESEGRFSKSGKVHMRRAFDRGR